MRGGGLRLSDACTAARPRRGAAAAAEWTDGEHAILADLGYEGERAALTTPIEHGAGRRLTDDQRTVNLLHAATRAPAERGNSLVKTTWRCAGSACAPGGSARSPRP